jgi:hypothetical protein
MGADFDLDRCAFNDAIQFANSISKKIAVFFATGLKLGTTFFEIFALVILKHPSNDEMIQALESMTLYTEVDSLQSESYRVVECLGLHDIFPLKELSSLKTALGSNSSELSRDWFGAGSSDALNPFLLKVDLVFRNVHKYSV